MDNDVPSTFDDVTPWLERDWRMIRKYRLNYPQKRIDSPEGCNCDHFIHKAPHNNHSAGAHYHAEDDTTQAPHKEELPPIFLEKKADGSYTTWSYSIYGPIGQTGTLTPEAEGKLEKVTRRKDRGKLAQFVKTLEHAERRGQIIAESMLTAKHGEPVDLSKNNGKNDH